MTSVASFTDLLREQEELAGYIRRFWTNVCKVGKEKMTWALLEQRKSLLERYWDSFFSGHRSLMRCKEAATSSYVQDDTYSETEEAYLQAAAMITQTLAEQSSTSTSMGEKSLPPVSLTAQLPKIELPPYAGDPLKWESFRDLFKSLVHDVPHMPQVNKLLYLKSCLTGEAAEVVRNTPVTDAGYAGAWEDLEIRYGNIRLLSFARHRALLSCPPAQHQTPSELKRLLDTVRQSIRAYSVLRKPIKEWDEWFVYILSQKLDQTTHVAWETSLADSKDIPSFDQLSKFLENRIQALDAAARSDPVLRPGASRVTHRIKSTDAICAKRGNSTVLAASSKVREPRKCPLCAGLHSLGCCAKFKALPPAKRRDRAHGLGVCGNCLYSGHEVRRCGSKQACLACGKPHHTLLHAAFAGEFAASANSVGPAAAAPTHFASGSEDLPLTATSLSLATRARSTALLATARVKVEGPSGHCIEVRALLDTGSDSCLITEWVAQALRLSRRAVKVSISGVQEQETGVSSAETDLVVRPRHDSHFRLPVSALILRRLTSHLPVDRIKPTAWPHLDGLTLADPAFGVPARVDLILGAEVCGRLFQDATRHGPPGTPTAKLTPFGWILMGPVSSPVAAPGSVVRSFHCRAEDTTHQLLQRFWELEELPEKAPLSADEEWCEKHFLDTHHREDDGRYVVRLPFLRDPVSTLGSSRRMALKFLLSCERRLGLNALLREKYECFMHEYSSLQHMRAVTAETEGNNAYYLPHHAVTKRHDPDAKLRVVFNASFPSANGASLNDCLAAGPKLQADLWMVLTRWRLFRIVFTTDIIKMFRQIRVHPADVNWQRILWRNRPDDQVQDFALTTVTYGTTCAPYLALRVLEQLASDEESRFPLGAAALRRHRYVDDILAGADSEDQALDLKRQVVAILGAGAFELSKWAGNTPELQEDEAPSPRLFHESGCLSTLGVIWSPQTDCLSLRVVAAPTGPSAGSKRSILSEVASLFDPLGWASPVLIFAKILLQDLWILGVDWDQELPEEIKFSWAAFRGSLSQLDAFSVPRWTHFVPEGTVELHGFCDASQRAYAAAVYLRVSNGGRVSTTLLVAKTKVAPVKTVSIPRLELCGAVLLAKLLVAVREGLDLSAPVTAWTDSSVALEWIRGHASLWKPFVAHRVSAIQGNIAADHWRHVNSTANPADLATRGISPAELIRSALWWHGPPWLKDSPESWPSAVPKIHGDAEMERRKATVHIAVESAENLLTKFSSLARLLSVVAYCNRFMLLTRRRPCPGGHIRPLEYILALRAVLRMSQRIHFQEEVQLLEGKGALRRSSPLCPLRPILGEHGLLRVGGRLDSSPLPYAEKHPVIIAKTCPLARLLVRDAHLRTLHGGPQLTTSLIARQFWILRGRSLVRTVIKECVKCARFSGRPAGQIMGPLPVQRTVPQRAFFTSGVEYAGPIMLRTTPGRGHKFYKGYIALFVCLATRAIHLDAVSDLTSAAFIAAFRRFTSRRGRRATLLSDNGTVFRGADRELRLMFRQASEFYQGAAPSLAIDGTDWKFIPPRAPHFGGLWEAGVKSMKHHLRRVIGTATLTFEEMATLLCQIEACLNSRLLYALSTDATDLSALTPGYFLIGEPTAVVPEPEAETERVSLSTRWRQISHIRSSFWHRWRREYLHTLQQLPKWRRQRESLEVGSLVLLRDELQPPARWPMGRVEAVHPGLDGNIRVVTLRTAKGTLTRPIVKVCLLPVATADATGA